MRILIVNPPYHKPIIREGRCQSPQNMRKTCIPQMTLAYLAAALNKSGHTLAVYDCIALDMTPGGLFAKLDNFSPEMALINTTTPSIRGDLDFIHALKEKHPGCFTAVFGTHVTAVHKEIMEKNPFVDCVIRHEPEWSAMNLAAALQNGGIPLEGVANCTVRAAGEIVVSAETDYNGDLDSLPYPAWEHFPKEQYIHPIFNEPYVMVNTSRGCVHNCIFCVASIFYGKNVRYRSVASIVDELEKHVIGKFGIRYVWMYADDFTRSPGFVKELCRAIIRRGIKITWWANTRVDKKDGEMFRLMKDAGCFMLSIGGESGSEKILKTMKKGSRPEDIKETVRLLRQVGINSLVYFLIGLPGETCATIAETVNFAREVNPDYVEFYPATPYPGTAFFDMATDAKSIADANWDNYMCGGDQFVVEIPGVSKGELNVILRKAYRGFYFRPGYAALLLKRASRPPEFLRLMKFGLGYARRFIAADSQ